MGNSEGGIGKIEAKKRAVGYLAETHTSQESGEILFNEEGEVVRVDKSPKLPRTGSISTKRTEEVKDEGRKPVRGERKVQSIDVSRRRGILSASASRKASPDVSMHPSPRVDVAKSQLHIRSKPPPYRLKQRLDSSFPVTDQFTVFSPHPPFLQDSRPQKPSKHRVIVQSSYKLLPVKPDFLSLSHSSAQSSTLDRIKDKRCHKGVISLSPDKKQVSKSFLSAYIPDLSKVTGSIHIKASKQLLVTSVPVSPLASRPPKGSRAERVWTWKGSHGRFRPRKKGKEGQ